MTIRQTESAIILEAREVLADSTLNKSRLMEWSSDPIEQQPGEIVCQLPKLGLYASFSKLPERTIRRTSYR